ncbi:thiol:disulfide interchange protein DsbA/DsbL [Ideonella sp.]|uniref:thiol:disulfide interchange protein DsbA/DsbL n=1 Tax=Ideonella sp. TaxID=1929293 RepID=UPI002B4824E4|nr:thiol:disulfide interchange protein DsbA/DsbL [Ideonella sp.]HJV69421.1 thiol:disulfide interchange protein DsbA/DsbL [Ideonella sp.]
MKPARPSAPVTRRDFHSIGIAAAASGLGLLGAGPARAQGGPVEGTHYQRLAKPIPMATTGKIEVAEFFWYGCPHCFALEPALEQWLTKLPPDVNFRRVPAGFTPQYEFHQKVFYALEAMGQLGNVHRKLFNAIHQEHKRMSTEAEVTAFVASLGVDGAKFAETMKSFSVIGKVRQARQLADAYAIDGVPTLGVQGRWRTSASMAGGVDKTFVVADYLIAQARKSL